MDFADGCIRLAVANRSGERIKKTAQSQNHHLEHLNLFL